MNPACRHVLVLRGKSRLRGPACCFIFSLRKVSQLISEVVASVVAEQQEIFEHVLTNLFHAENTPMFVEL